MDNTLNDINIIKDLENQGLISPDCKECMRSYQSIKSGNGMPVAPSHEASIYCQCGKRPHCSCDVCF